MITQFQLWPCVAGVVFLLLGWVAVRKELSAAAGLDKLVVLGRVFFATPLAVFSMEHLAGAKFLMGTVPKYMPAPLFWTYLVGVALLAAALSIEWREQVLLSGSLLAVMFFFFVAMLMVPGIAANPRSRLFWVLAFRESSFASGALALAAMDTTEWRERGTSLLVTIARTIVGAVAVFYAVEHFLHPEISPGVPLEMLTPHWVPLPLAWSYLTGAVLLVAGVCMVLNWKARMAGAWLGLWITLLTLFIYLPFLLMGGKAGIINGVNNVFDTMFYAGTVLVVAAASGREGLAARSSGRAYAGTRDYAE